MLEFERTSRIENQTRLWHHNVVTVRDVYESSNSVYIVMDYCPGGTLDGILELRRKIDEEETRFIFINSWNNVLLKNMTFMFWDFMFIQSAHFADLKWKMH